MSQQSSSQSLSHIPAVPDTSVPLALLQGTTMLKVSAKKEKRALFRVDPDEGQICYESRKSGISTSCCFDSYYGPVTVAYSSH